MISLIDTSTLGPIKVGEPKKKEVFEAKLADLKAYADQHMVPGRPKAMVLTKLDEARMWANEVEDALPPQ